VVDEISAIAARLADTDLRPGPLVNSLFQTLVAAACAVDPESSGDRDTQTTAALHDLCSRGETHLERHWGHRVTAVPKIIDEFPYLNNYRQLIAAEYQAIVDTLGRPPRTLLFTGSGPLPLSAILLARSAPGLHITCLDRDARALRQARRVARALTLTSTMRFVRADASEYDYAAYDAVVLAALVGLTAVEKQAVLTRVGATLAPESLLAARSVPADGRRLLYPRIEPATVPATLRVLGEIDPPPGVINSLLLMRSVRIPDNAHSE
jgi:nicotianamine synthase